MKDILNHTQSYNYNWSNQIKNYDYERTHLAWEKNPIPPRVTTKMVKHNDLAFDLILQKYADKSLENSLRQKEKKEMISSIIKNQDKQLKVEQTFNIINLQDRLKGFENHPDYPKQKDLINKRKKINYNLKNYNILSNLPLTIHHFDKPENRPQIPENDKEANKKNKPKPFRMSNQERDYDIITSKYKCYNDEKVNLDKELNKLQTAKIFYKNNDYNPVKGVYFNEEKEEAYKKMEEEKKKNWGKEKMNNMPKCAKGRSDIYDLISLKVVDKKEFDKMVTEEKNKKKRYELRNEMDKYYHERSLLNQDKEMAKYNKNRNNNINNNINKYYINKNLLRNKLNDWEKILKGASKNNTFGTKALYKDHYEHSETGVEFDKFKLIRNKTLAALPRIGEDKTFIRKKKISKCGSYREIKKNVLGLRYDFNKERFFKERPKDVDLRKINGVNTSKNIRKRDREFLANKEKNQGLQGNSLEFNTQPDNKN